MSGHASVALLGSSGFVGSAIRAELEANDLEVLPVRAPRISHAPAGLAAIHEAVHREAEARQYLRRSFRHVEAVVCAAGVADPAARDEAMLFGANAVLPRVVREAVVAADVPRFVHISSAAVQGQRRMLDESTGWSPFSRYSWSKALGEKALGDCPETVMFRPTSVHGVDRPVTRALARLARSRWASVAGDGSAASPQVLVRNVASAVRFVCRYDGPVPSVVLQPAEGITTASLLEILGGRPPRRIPRPLADALLLPLRQCSGASGRLQANVRRLEMLWFGQDQVPGWLLDHGWSPAVGPRGWHELAGELAAGPREEPPT